MKEKSKGPKKNKRYLEVRRKTARIGSSNTIRSKAALNKIEQILKEKHGTETNPKT